MGCGGAATGKLKVFGQKHVKGFKQAALDL